MKQKKKDSLADELVPILVASEAARADNGEPEDDDSKKLRSLLQMLVEDKLEERAKAQKRKDALAMAAVEEAKARDQATKSIKGRCSHRKTNNDTRLAGQRLSNGQICLVCQFCQSEFFIPPNEELNQVPPPRELIPPADQIGG